MPTSNSLPGLKVTYRIPLTVVVPAYQEAGRIFDALGLLLRSLESIGDPFEVIVVSDGNIDGTEVEAARHGGAVRVVHYPTQRGKGYALRRGVAESSGDVVAFIDADMELHPDGLAALVAMVNAGADAAIGSKRHAESIVSYPRFRRFQSAAYQALIRRLFDLNVTDTQTGIKAFRGDLLRQIAPLTTSNGFAFDLELLVELRAHGAQIVEGPIQLDYGFESTTGVRAVVQVLRETGRIYRLHHLRMEKAAQRGKTSPSRVSPRL
jgi:glycosyltransferase involved in cell wall biosynthesis